MRLFIAEKPSLGRAIAEGLGGGKPKSGHIDCGNDIVTWCFGHMFELCDPGDYDPAWKSWKVLPIIPTAWKLKACENCMDQLAIIKKLLREATHVVNAGDPDREGQLLVDEVLEHFDYRGPAERIWLASLDARSVAKALATLRDNKQYANLRDAARARAQADWLIGLNGTRAMTNIGRDAGRDGVLSLGRVQTPTLNLVVMRDREIASFRPQEYLVLQGTFHSAGQFVATFSPGETQPGCDTEGRLTDPCVANSLSTALRGAHGHIHAVSKEEKKKLPPLPHCLSSLQKAASSRLEMTAQQVLNIAQKLYEAKLTTYPRTDCRYLPMEQRDNAANILSSLAKIPELSLIVGSADMGITSAAWNTSKVTAHHAIIPTGVIPGPDLKPAERALYSMICMSYCLQFYPALRYESQKICVEIENTTWEARGRMVLDPGWTQCDSDADGEEGQAQEQSLPSVAQGDDVACAGVETQRKKTSPPSRFSEGTLIEAMANVHRFVTDAAAKITLRENEGIGTEATRASILETLKSRGYLKAQGKALTSTALAGQVIDLTPQSIKDPVTTAQWESRLEAIAQGKDTLDAFMSAQTSALPQLLGPLLSNTTTINLTEGPVHPCPQCGKPLQKRKGERGPYWCCLRKAEHSDEQPVFLPDDRGRPGQRVAPIVSEYTCPSCGKGLIRRKGISKQSQKPYDFYGCPDKSCNKTFNTKDGKPDFGK